MSKYELGYITIIRHEIFTGDHRPIKQAPRRMPLNKKEIVQKEVQAMLQNGIIEPSVSPWSSPVVLVEKKDHSTRFWVDYRALNEKRLPTPSKYSNIKSEMRSFKSNENIHKKEGGSYYIVSANKASSVTL